LTFQKVIASTLPFWEIVPRPILENHFSQIFADRESLLRKSRNWSVNRECAVALAEIRRAPHGNSLKMLTNALWIIRLQRGNGFISLPDKLQSSSRSSLKGV
jgi:hypothetical protein